MEIEPVAWPPDPFSLLGATARPFKSDGMERAGVPLSRASKDPIRRRCEIRNGRVRNETGDKRFSGQSGLR